MKRLRSKTPAPSRAGKSLHLRLNFDGERSLGPGKARLLELIGETGSISAAGRDLKMSYRRAWQLVDELNRMFCEPVVKAKIGGGGGGGATLTTTGATVVRLYRKMERRAAGATEIGTLTALLG